MADDPVTDEYHRSALILITTFKGGDLIHIQRQPVEIVVITEEGSGLLFRLEDGREFVANDTQCRRRGQLLKTNHRGRPTISVDPGAGARMTAKANKRKRR